MNTRARGAGWLAAIVALAVMAANTGGALAQAPAPKQKSAAKPRPVPARVDVTAYSLEGRTLLDTEDFSRIVDPFVGAQKSAADIERARSAVQQAYRDLGYCGIRVNLVSPRPREGVVQFRLAALAYKKSPDCLPAARLEQRAKPAVIVSSPPKPVIVAQPVAVTEPAPPPPPPAPEPPAYVPPPRFDIKRFEIVGSSALSNEEMEQLVAPHTGQNKDFADIQRALEALEQAFRDRGYGVAQVILPEQDITRGVVQFRIVQPRVGRVVIEGNTRFDAENIRRSLPTVKEGETPNSKDIARNLQITGEHPVKQTNVLLRAGASEDQVDVAIKVTDDKPWRAFFTLDNTGTGETGYFRTGFGVQHTNLFNRDHTLTASYITSPGHVSDVTIFGLGYRMPFYDLNSSLDLIAGYSDVNSGVVQGLFNVSGSGSIFAARWNYFLHKWKDMEQKLTFGLDYRAFKNEVLVAGQPLVPDITVRPASVTYSGLYRMTAAELSFYAGAAANIPGGNDGDQAAFTASRPGANDDYTMLRYGMNYTRQFRNEWQTRFGFNGQYTSNALVAGEQYGIGGPDTVRGYLLREVANDKGYSGQVELYTPDLARGFGMTDAYKTRLLAFYDWGSVERNHALPGEIQRDSIASVGVGLRLTYKKSVSLRLDLAQILQETANRDNDSQRVTGALAIVF
ncbi:MAG TPA: POTRA domain-containing protein [Burkholderiales bacterium]|nr:POTRA domain-containing protein [Burkholderiales bacterium]